MLCHTDIGDDTETEVMNMDSPSGHTLTTCFYCGMPITLSPLFVRWVPTTVVPGQILIRAHDKCWAQRQHEGA